ncbi:transmembrane protein 61 [Carettochelys insculpta]|uniref:transmembrane protein 61 n=1 Tax=Carettochelys insculpta TaxID=44489 RepID=UPI003EB7BC31
MAASFRYGVTITGAVLLVTGTLCFAWWSDGEVGPPSNSDAVSVPHGEAKVVPNSSSSNALLRSVSFFCCGIGGILLLFGLLWSVKANARGMSRHYQYHFSRDLHYFTVEPLDKRTFSAWDSSAIPTYEEALNCRPAQSHLSYTPRGGKEEGTLPLYEDLDEDERWPGSRRRSSSDSMLLRTTSARRETESQGEPSATPPPSYEDISVRGV